MVGLRRATGPTTTAVAEKAIDRLAGETAVAADPGETMSALLSQLDRIADRPDAFDPLRWDACGLAQ